MNASLLPVLVAANKYRLIDWDLPRLFPGTLDWHSGPVIVLLLIVGSLVAGAMFAKAIRLREYGWKVGLILASILVSTFIVLFGEFKLGVDLKGGVILVYEVNELETAQLHRGRQDWDMGQLIAVITRRLNPTGLKEIVVRPFGPKQVEIVVPEVDPKEIEEIKEKIRTGGVLQFMIVASDERDTELWEIARQQAERPADRLRRDVLDVDGRQVGYWARLAREEGDPRTAPFRALDVVANGYLRDARTGELLELSRAQKQLFASSQSAFEAFLKERGTNNVDVLMVYDPDFAIRGDDLAMAYAGHDEALRPAIHFTMGSEGALKMGHVTQENLHRKLAIIFDGQLLSAPVIQSKISENGQITGNFTQQEVDFIVGILKSGSMPVVMQKNPISENQIGAILGMDTIIKGSWSIAISLLLVLAFTWAYYRFSGFVACCALVLNLLLTLALMILLRAPLTLPGLAGLVLTVGMSVDSNVLIFERMREELARGAALRMAIRNGFDRAMVTIIDSNLTTLLTAVVLYSIGTDQVKGFGITLILGILTSMYTAIFCARTVFEIGERKYWLKTLRMTQFLTRPNVDWVKLFAPATVASMVVILVGLVATVARGRGLFDIDLAGGTSVTFVLNEPVPVSEVRQRLDQVLSQVVDPQTKTRAQFTAYELALSGDLERPQTVYKVDCSLLEIELLKQKVREALRTPDGRDLLKTYRVELARVEAVPVEPPPPPVLKAPGQTSPVPPTGTPPPAAAPASPPAAPAAPPPAQKDQNPEGARSSAPAEPTPSPSPAPAEPAASRPPMPSDAAPKAESTPKAENQGGAAGDVPGCGESLEQETAEPNKEPSGATTTSATSDAAAPAEAPGTASDRSAAPSAPPAVAPVEAADQGASPPASALPVKVRSRAVLRFPSSPISAAALRTRVVESGKAVLHQELTEIDINNPEWDGVDNTPFEEWTVTIPVPLEDGQKVFDHLREQLANSVAWQTSSQIGGQVSADTRLKAMTAILVSLLGIVAYMWFRFQKAVWGIAAVVALAHDTLVMLGGLAVSYWLADWLGFLGIEQFKISLPVIAAFLTLIGFSVNDTIVIFDRLREIRGKSPNLTPQMLNDAVNLTMSRTILTSGTVFMVVVVLYFFGGPGIHAFAFSLVIGVLSGTYSTVFIAAPLLLWLFNRGQKPAPVRVEVREPSRSVA
jgi:SecD/SecF fusion protein